MMLAGFPAASYAQEQEQPAPYEEVQELPDGQIAVELK